MNKEKVAVLFIALIFILIFIGNLLLMVFAITSLPFFIISTLITLLLVWCIYHVTKQRLKEIREEEKDDLSNY